MKVLIHDERSDALEFLLEGIVNRGYKAGIAKDSPEIINMLSDERYDVVLTNGGYEKIDLDKRFGTKTSSVCIIGIINERQRDDAMGSEVDRYLRRPFEASRLWQAIASTDH